jgi:hypothetical protein
MLRALSRSKGVVLRFRPSSAFGGVGSKMPDQALGRGFASMDPDEMSTWDRMKSSMQGKIDGSQKAKGDKMFDELMTTMLNTKTYNMQVY